ncbi:CLUMA_CG016191, isoform A [Clunio marinus]|uniref:Large ribosomal subunit protein eL27 n=1 Tax=Clunio marinus TaxID=568069 RepID=A0A1J1IT40_9DIPT|nr:CLUMA_CG016191, isoform A [Clunio marinus]
MGKIMKTGKVVIVLSGRYAGRKGIIMKSLEEGTNDKQFGQAIIAGIQRYPRRVSRKMSKAKVHKNCRIKPFVKIFNYNHLMPTRYNVSDLSIDNKYTIKDLKDPVKRKKIRFQIRMRLEDRFKCGRNKWFFSKLRF